MNTGADCVGHRVDANKPAHVIGGALDCSNVEIVEFGDCEQMSLEMFIAATLEILAFLSTYERICLRAAFVTTIEAKLDAERCEIVHRGFI